MIEKPFKFGLLAIRRNLGKNSWENFKLFHTCSVNNKKQYKIKSQQEIESVLRQKAKPFIEIWYPMTIGEICKVFKTNKDIIALSLPGVDLRQSLDRKEITALARKLHKKCVFIKNPNLPEVVETEKKQFLRQPPPKPEDLVKRPPVVTVMGHVDHGKTTLLDALRNTFVVDKEFGGITQHIGAFSVEVKSGNKITFIDTPGHAAFTTMRARGAEVTDLVVLVIAADDGIMEQTIESIKIAKRAHVKMIVAVNKIDKPKALSIDVIKEKLLEHGIQVEDKGGDVQIVPISALKKINLDLLVEMILIEAEIMNLKADPRGLVEGVVIESKMDFLGPVATIIVQRGTLKKGCILYGGESYAKVRILKDENGKEYSEVHPSTPVQVFGWKSLPKAGQEVFQVDSEKNASRFVKQWMKQKSIQKQEDERDIITEKARLEQEKIRNWNLQYKSLKTVSEKRKWKAERWERERRKLEEDTKPSLNLIIKGDVHGTVEVLTEILGSYDKEDECKMEIIEASVGEIVQSDLELAEMAKAIIYAFNVNPHPTIKESIKEKKIDIRTHNIIYKMIDDLREELSARLLPKSEESVLGEALVNQHFWISVKKKKVPVAGCKCVHGELQKNALFKVVRDEEVIYEGKLISMKHHKNEVGKIKINVECGLMFDSFSGEFKPMDKVICYEIVQVPQKTSWNPGF